MQQVDAELKSFFEYCRQVGFDDDELAEICRPLYGFTRKNCFKKWLIVLCVLISLVLGLYALSSVESLQWHTSAIGRILMIKLLPFWDWTTLFYKRCLIERKQLVVEDQIPLSLADCDMCESIASVQHVSGTKYDDILNHFLIRSAPVIVTDANSDWITSKIPNVNLTHVLLDDDRLRDSIPCVLQTNLRTGRQPADLSALLTKVTGVEMSNWFFHFQNCDLQAVKVFRTAAPRPYFLSPHIPPAHYNWLLMSNKYASSRFKSLELEPGLIVMSQLKGSTLVQLTPRFPCETTCPGLAFDVHEAETLVLSNSIWRFEYMTDDNLLNIAVLTETAWNDD